MKKILSTFFIVLFIILSLSTEETILTVSAQNTIEVVQPKSNHPILDNDVN